MASDILNYKTTLAGSLLTQSEDIAKTCIDSFANLPPTILKLVLSSNTGSYIRGIAKSYHIEESIQPNISFIILQVTLGKINMSDLSTRFASELNITADTALKMASEIDQDLFAPIQGELDAFWESQKTTAPSPLLMKERLGEVIRPQTISSVSPTSPNPSSGRRGNDARTPNVLNLKELTARSEPHFALLASRDKQKDLPARPVQQKLTPGNRIVNLKNTTTIPSPLPAGRQASPLPEQERGTTRPSTPLRVNPLPPVPPARTFPLPPNPRPFDTAQGKP